MHNVVIRQLPAGEWDKLVGLPLTAKGMPDPERCIVLVGEANGEIVATWVVIFAPFLDGLWIREDYRKKTFTFARLLAFMKKFLVSWKIDEITTIVQSDYVQGLAEKAGFVPFNGTIMKFTAGDKN